MGVSNVRKPRDRLAFGHEMKSETNLPGNLAESLHGTQASLESYEPIGEWVVMQILPISHANFTQPILRSKFVEEFFKRGSDIL